MADFCSRAPRQGLSAKQIEALMKAGTIDDLTERGHAVEKAGLIWETINANSATRETGQMSMFGTTRERTSKRLKNSPGRYQTRNTSPPLCSKRPNGRPKPWA